jgi:hypothetical protein
MLLRPLDRSLAIILRIGIFNGRFIMVSNGFKLANEEANDEKLWT